MTEEEWNEEVLERLTAYAKRIDTGIEEVKGEFIAYLASDFSIDDWKDEDIDRIVDLAEGFFMETRRARGGGGTIAYVGHFLGPAANVKDRRESQREKFSRQYQENPDEVISSGDIGVFSSKEGKWFVQTKNGLVDTGEEVVDGALPTNCFRSGETLLGLLVKNPESPNYGKPYPCYAETRYFQFLGNTEVEFENEIRMLRIAATGESVNASLRYGLPCRFQARPVREDVQEAWADVIDTFDDWETTVEYTDEFVDPDLRRDLRAERFWTSQDFHDYYVELDELGEIYEARKQKMSDGSGHFGPIVITKGFVCRMSTEAKASEYDQTGRNFSMDISSMALQQAYGGDDRAEVRLWIPGAVYDLAHPFQFRDDVGWVDFAERSTVLVCGRIGLRPSGQHFEPKMNVIGIYAIPNRARRRQSGGDTGLSQFD